MLRLQNEAQNAPQKVHSFQSTSCWHSNVLKQELINFAGGAECRHKHTILLLLIFRCNVINFMPLGSTHLQIQISESDERS